MLKQTSVVEVQQKCIVSACITDRPCITERAHLRIRKIFHTRETLQNPSQMKFE